MRAKKASLAIVTAIAAATPVGAGAVELHGYLRSGIGGNGKGGTQVCFQVPNTDFKFRLGNECENYAEIELRESLYKDKGGVEFNYVGMLAYISAERQDFESLQSTAGNDIALRQNFIEVKNLIPGGANAWAGKRYFHRNDVHIIDFYHFDPSGFGGGVDDIPVGGLFKGAVTVFQNKSDDLGRVVWRPEIRAYAIPIPGAGQLEAAIMLGIISEADANRAPGRAGVSPWFTLQHFWQGLGGYNKLAFQYGTGLVAGLNQFPSYSATSDAYQWRIVEQLQVQPISKLSAMFTFVYQNKTRVNEDRTLNGANPAGVNFVGDSSTSWAIGARPVFHVNDFFKVQAEIGYQSITPKSQDLGSGSGFLYANTDRRELFKVSVAPTIVAGGTFWSRPELRVFATYAAWNAATRSAGQGTTSCGASGTNPFPCDTHFTFGAQAEAWW